MVLITVFLKNNFDKLLSINFLKIAGQIKKTCYNTPCITDY